MTSNLRAVSLRKDVSSARREVIPMPVQSHRHGTRRLGVEPWAYLEDVLTRLPTTTKEHFADLLPDRWKAAQTKPGS